MEEVASLERHLLHAKARALAEEEKTLSEKKETLGAYESVKLPSGTYMVYMYIYSVMYIWNW